MNTEEFRKHGKAMIDYICNYMDNVQDRNVTPSVEPGYLKELVPGKYFKQINLLMNVNRVCMIIKCLYNVKRSTPQSSTL